LNILEIKKEVVKFVPDEPQRGVHAHFMNLDIIITSLDGQPQNFQLRKYNKRRDLPFAYTQYIKFWSNRPIKQSYAVAVSQTFPIMYLSSSVEDASTEIHRLIATLETNGFKRPRLITEINWFLMGNNFPGIRFDLKQLVNQLR